MGEDPLDIGHLINSADLDNYYQTSATFKGRLHGIPVLVNDQADTKDIVQIMAPS